MNLSDREHVSQLLDRSLTVWAVLLWAGVLYYSYTQEMARAKYGIVFLGAILGIYIIDELSDAVVEDDRLDIALLLASSAVTLVTTVYLYLNFKTLNTERVGYALPNEYVLAAVFTFVLIYLTWRSFGITFLTVLVGGILYGLFGDLIPGLLGHGGISHTRMLLVLVLSFKGFYGFLNQLVAAWIALFLLYAGFLKGYGAFDVIFRLAARSTKFMSSGIAQTAVLASAVIGSINGSQTANAGMTGSFTIPLMKENDMKPETAAGIEAVASTSGQVLPPVMGAGAFVMAMFVSEATYVDILVSGLIPAVILVVSIIVAVHYVSIRQLGDVDMGDMAQEPKSRRELAMEAIKFGPPFIVLIYMLGIAQYTVPTSALYTAVTMFLTGTLLPLAEKAYEADGFDAISDQIRSSGSETVEGLRTGALATAPVAIILAAINGVVEVLMTTGVPGSISLALMGISGGILLVAAILAMIICILMGLGMPTTASYTVVAILVAPTLESQFLVPELSAHFFVFYAAILAGLTPPIATCAAVAASIADADFWKTCVESIKISAPLFVLPFAFIYHPPLVAGEFGSAAFISGGLALVGALSVIHGVNASFDMEQTVALAGRTLFVVLGIVTMVHPEFTMQAVSLVTVAALFGMHRFTDIGQTQSAAQPSQ